jgi:hypothetical protein
MPGSHGNDNLYRPSACQYLTVDGTSDNVTLGVNTQAVSLYSTEDCWVRVGIPGETPTAAAPGAEKTRVFNSFFLPATTVMDIPVPTASDSAQVKIAAIQDSAGGTLHVTERQG